MKKKPTSKRTFFSNLPIPILLAIGLVLSAILFALLPQKVGQDISVMPETEQSCTDPRYLFTDEEYEKYSQEIIELFLKRDFASILVIEPFIPDLTVDCTDLDATQTFETFGYEGFCGEDIYNKQLPVYGFGAIPHGSMRNTSEVVRLLEEYLAENADVTVEKFTKNVEGSCNMSVSFTNADESKEAGFVLYKRLNLDESGIVITPFIYERSRL